jgi:cyclic-di-AMP phosphodiesterase PgpH
MVIEKSSETTASEAQKSHEDSHVPVTGAETMGRTSSLIGWFLVVVVGFLALLVAFTAHHVLYPGVRLGDIVDHDIRASKTVVVVDGVETKKAEETVRHSIMPVLKEDTSHYRVFVKDIAKQLDQIEQMQKEGLVPSPKLPTESHLALITGAEELSSNHFVHGAKQEAELIKQRQLLQKFLAQDPPVNTDQVYIALSIKPEDWKNFSNNVISAGHKACRVVRRFPVDDNRFWHETVVEFLSDQWPIELRQHVSSLICSALTPNFIIDEARTHQKADRAVAQLKPVMKTIPKGTVVLPKNGWVTEDNIDTLKAVGAVPGINWHLIFSIGLSLAAACGLVGMYLSTYEPQYLKSKSTLGLIFTVCVLTGSVATAIGARYPEFVPLPMAALVLTIFFGRRTALIISLPILILLACDRIIDLNNLVALGAASGAAIGTYSKKRHDLVSCGLVVGMMQALGYICSLAIVQPVQSPSALGKAATLELFGGIASAMFAIGLLPFLENIFGMLTPFRLAELVNADQPLLRRLEEEAPGTYQHSLAVANLAEAGAHAINADAMLVRTGALYHDIGKMAKPKYFIENQLGDKNPHDTMSPEESRERVLGHVTDGLLLAKKYSVPRAVQDFIPMHQGTCLMAYFYHKACLRDGQANVDQRFYRYPGPKPQSKETAIVMMADVSEAVTHSMADPSQEEVEEVLTKVFENRWQDGQLDQSGITYSQLQEVKKAFVRVWRTLHHERIKYPSTTTGRMPIVPDNLPQASPEMEVKNESTVDLC